MRFLTCGKIGGLDEYDPYRTPEKNCTAEERLDAAPRHVHAEDIPRVAARRSVKFSHSGSDGGIGRTTVGCREENAFFVQGRNVHPRARNLRKDNCRREIRDETPVKLVGRERLTGGRM